MVIRTLLAAAIAAVTLAAPMTAQAGQRYATPPPVTLSPDLEGAWTLQLRANTRVKPRRKARRIFRRKTRVTSRRASSRRVLRARNTPPPRMRVASVTRNLGSIRTTAGGGFDPTLAPRMVAYETPHRAGTIIVDTIERRLYLVKSGGMAMRYAIGVGKPGFEWSGSHKVTRKKEWPGWTPPKEMIAREAAKGRILPAHMPGGPENPLGARALYLGSTLYRIHGTNQAWSIGKAVSSGCIRMRNEDVMDLYDRVKVGVKVHVI